MHASSTGFLYAFGISATSPLGPAGYAVSFIVYAFALWVVVVILGASYGKGWMQVAQPARSSLVTLD
jgi:hypothetical protein